MQTNSTIVCALLASACAALAADVPLVKEYVASPEIATIGAYAPVSVAGPDFKTAVMVDVSASSTANGPAQTARDARRASNYTGAAVAAAVGKVVPAFGPAETAPPPSGSYIAFKQSWNSAQAWATMRGNGMPFLSLQAFGKSSAMGAASWNARVVMPQTSGLYLRFRLPSLALKGTLESDGPSLYQGRLRAEILVNGHSVWTSEASRLNQLYGNSSEACIGDSEKQTALIPFGAPTGLASSQQATAPARTVTLGLGQFSAGQEVNVMLVVRADSQVNRICCIKPVNNVQESFCTGMVATVAWSDEPNPVAFTMGPVL